MCNLFDALDNLELGARGEVDAVGLLAQQELEILGDLAAGDVVAHHRVRQREALEDGHRVSHAVARVEHHAGRASGRVQTEHGLHGDVQSGRVERLEEDLGHFLAIATRIQRRLGQQHRMLSKNQTTNF